MIIKQVEEYRMDDKLKMDVDELIHSCFSGYPKGRTYLKQLPQFRLLTSIEDRIVGHLAVEFRLISLDHTAYKIFGIADLCVHPDYQSRRIGSRMIEKLEKLAKLSEVDYLILIADQPEYYKRMGFIVAKNTCRWVVINNNKTLGVAHRNLHECLMVKPIGDRQWRGGLLDFLGHIF